MPFLTEEIWQQLPKSSGTPQSIMITLYPVRDVRFHDDASEASMALVQKIIVALRSIRTERNIPTSARLTALLAVNDDYKKTILEGYKTIIAEQAKCGEVRVRRSGASFSGEFVLSKTAMAMAGDVEVMVPLEGLVDPQAELAKLQKEEVKLKSDIAYVERKLADPNYMSRAPLAVVEKDKAKLAEEKASLAKLSIAIERLKS
jgi:valyl-tRNA synthetase